MKALKKLTLSLGVLTVSGFVINGFYNSYATKNVSFMSENTGIKFTKRLDELNGRIQHGRMAASTKSWTKIAEEPKKQPQIIKKIKIANVKTVNEVTKSDEPKTAEPAIKGDLDLTVSNVFYKEPLKEGSFSGSARTMDGVIEEIFVNLPGGDQISISTRDQMIGNVFQYEDAETREMKSGMLYEVKPGTYMVTLTNDSKYAGVRMEFTAQNNSEVAYSEEYYNETQNWNIDSQNTDQSGVANQGNHADNHDYYDTEQAPVQAFDFQVQI